MNILEELFYFTLFLLFADIKVPNISVAIPFKLWLFTVQYVNESCYLGRLNVGTVCFKLELVEFL